MPDDWADMITWLFCVSERVSSYRARWDRIHASKNKAPFSGYALPPHEEKGGSVPVRLTFFITLKTAEILQFLGLFQNL